MRSFDRFRISASKAGYSQTYYLVGGRQSLTRTGAFCVLTTFNPKTRLTAAISIFELRGIALAHRKACSDDEVT
jgi:hypothetical protein